MITTRYALCALRVIRDAAEDRITAVDIFEDIQVQSFPLFIPRITFIWGLKRESGDPEQSTGHIEAYLDGNQLMHLPINIDFRGTFINRQIVAVGGLVITQPGRVRTVFHANNIEDVSYYFDVSAVPQPIPQPPQSPQPIQ